MRSNGVQEGQQTTMVQRKQHRSRTLTTSCDTAPRSARQHQQLQCRSLAMQTRELAHKQPPHQLRVLTPGPHPQPHRTERRQGLTTKVDRSRKQLKERKNRTKKLRGVKKNKSA